VRWPAWLSEQPLGPMPAWFWWGVGLGAAAFGWIAFDTFVNWRWVWLWATGSACP
jgi:hypothetical protein